MIYGDNQKTTQVIAVYSNDYSMLDFNIEQQTKLNNYAEDKNGILYINGEKLNELGLNIKLNDNLTKLANGLQKNLFSIQGGSITYSYSVYDVIKTPDIQVISQAGNLYAYCINNPTRYIDPIGLFSWGNVGEATVKGAIVGAAEGVIMGAATGGTATVFTLTLPAATAGGILGGIGGAVAGFVQGILDELW